MMIFPDGTTPTISGDLPGSVTAVLLDETVASLSFDGQAMVGMGPGGNWPAWDSGGQVDGNGAQFVLYYMPPTTFAQDASGGQQYQSICEAAGLHTFCTMSRYGRTMRSAEGEAFQCLPGPNDSLNWGDWGGSDEYGSPDAIAESIGWDDWVIHGRSGDEDLMSYSDGQPHLQGQGYQQRGGGGTSWDSVGQY
eukprot:COSAG06_NODE_28296_length_577_cov_0.476987_1_plen_192_part_11